MQYILSASLILLCNFIFRKFQNGLVKPYTRISILKQNLRLKKSFVLFIEYIHILTDQTKIILFIEGCIVILSLCSLSAINTSDFRSILTYYQKTKFFVHRISTSLYDIQMNDVNNNDSASLKHSYLSFCKIFIDSDVFLKWFLLFY